MKKIVSLRAFYSVTGALVWIGYIALAAIILITFVDVAGRYLLNKPLDGSIELVELSMTLFGGFAIMYTSVKQEHVGVDVVIVRLSRRFQAVMRRVSSFLGLGAWAVLSWWAYVHALELLDSRFRETTSILGIHIGPFAMILAVATSLGCLALLIQAFHPGVAVETQGKKGEGVNDY